MSWIIAASTIFTSELLVRKNRYAWWLSLLNQGLWLAYICMLREWGLLPLTAVYTVQSIRGIRNWK